MKNYPHTSSGRIKTTNQVLKSPVRSGSGFGVAKQEELLVPHAFLSAVNFHGLVFFE